MRESQYTASVGRLLPSAVYSLKLNLRYAAGVADSWYSGAGQDLWVEWKYLPKIPRTVDLVGGKHPIISKLQQSWLRDRHAQGRHVAVIVGTPQGGVIYPELTWDKVFTQKEFCEQLVNKRALAAWISIKTQTAQKN